MSSVDKAIEIGELVIKTAEGLIDAIGKAKQELEDSTAQLKESIIAAKKKLHDDLAADRKAADEALDEKFDTSKSEDVP